MVQLPTPCRVDGEGAAQQRTQGRGPERHRDTRLEVIKFLLQPYVAGVDLQQVRFYVQSALAARLPLEMLDRVGQEDFAARESRRLKALLQHCTRRSDERTTLQILVIAGLLTHEHDPGVCRPFAADRLRRVLPQVHPWVAVKRSGAQAFTVYEVNGWRLGRMGSAVLASHRPPDGRWFGNPPALLADRRGAGVDQLIDRIEAAVGGYPWKGRYRVWPGPNSNTFIAHVLRAAPELRAHLPPTAIGKDYLGALPIARLPSGTGVQLNVLGVAGIAIGWDEGLEVNLLGLTFGIDPLHLAVKLPLIGRVGPKCLAAPLEAACGSATTD